MLKDITIGRYYNTDSIIHRLDPRTKMNITILFMILIFMMNHIASYVFIFAFLMILIKLANIPYKYVFKGLKGIMILLMFSVVINLFFTPGKPVISFYFLQITDEGIYNALIMSARLTLLILGSTLMTLTTTPIRLTDAIEKSLSPYKKFGIPAHEIALMMSMSMRYIPTLIDETDKIMKAQMARGANFETGSIFQRAKAFVPIFIPLFVNSFRRADELSMAMVSRCYNGADGRTKLNPLKYGKKDFTAYFIFVFFMVFSFILDHFVRTLI